jgi:hypothetical protein
MVSQLQYSGCSADAGLVPLAQASTKSMRYGNMDPPELPASARKMLIRDGDGFDGEGMDEEGYDLLGFNSAGLNRTGQSVSDFPPAFLNHLARTANTVRRSGNHWVAPPVLNTDQVRKMYPKWYEIQDSVFPEQDQVMLPLSLNSILVNERY